VDVLVKGLAASKHAGISIRDIPVEVLMVRACVRASRRPEIQDMKKIY